MMATQTLALNAFQERVMSVPETYDLFCGGGRGGGKSVALALLALRHAEQYGAKARILYIRKSYRALADFELTCREVFSIVYGAAAKYNGAENIWRFPNGAYMELGQLESHADFGKYQGRSFTLLMVDEAGQYADPTMLDMIRSNLRGPKDMPIRMVIAANPGGVGHHWIAKRYVFAGAGPWEPFREEKSKREWVYAPSTFAGNDLIDREQYRDQLESACPEDPELLRAWVEGDWSVVRGAYFAECLSEERNAINPWTALPDWNEFWLAHDFGSAAPSVTYLMAESPGAEHEGKWFPRGSIILVDELAAVRKTNLSQGLGWNVSVTAEAIRRDLCAKWDVSAVGVADDAIFARTGASAGSIAEEFGANGVYFRPAHKQDRITGWQRMRRMLADAGKLDKSGLYISKSCVYFWATVPFAPRCEKRVEDLDSSSVDHAADAVRYGLLRSNIVTDLSVKYAH